MITAKSISVELGGKTILRGLDFTAESGQVTAIVGPNGSGKTTLLKAITQEVIFSGEVQIHGTAPADYEPWKLASVRAVLPQASTLAFPFTVREIIRLGLTAGIHAKDESLVDQALSRVGLDGYGDRTFQELSGGEQQRAHLARVLCQVWEPVVDGVASWLLLDEPVASLDIGHQLQVIQLLRDFVKQGGGVIAVMHDLNLTAMFADNIAILSEGRIIEQGPTIDVFNDKNLMQAYGCKLQTNTAPLDSIPFVLPHSAR